MSAFSGMRNLLRAAGDYFGAAPARAAQTEDLQRATVDIAIERLRIELLMTDVRLADPRCLNRFEHKAYSQDGSDGIVREIFRRIGEGNRYFVEFGAADGLQNNTTFLLVQGWSGLWIEGDSSLCQRARAVFARPLADGELKLLNALVTRENVEDLFSQVNVPEEPAFLSIDVDGNDYWIWRAIEHYRPRVVEIEYNAMFPPDVSWVMRYNPEHEWRMDCYQGAGLRSVADLGVDKGYVLVACSLAGTNAFFVRKDLLDAASDKFVRPFNPAQFYQPPRYFMIQERAGHPRAFGPADVV